MGQTTSGFGRGREGDYRFQYFHYATLNRLLGKVLVPQTVANLSFGGRNRSRLFVCASRSLYAIYLNCRGAQHP